MNTVITPNAVRPYFDTMLYAAETGKWAIFDPILGPERVDDVKPELIYVNAHQPATERFLRIKLYSPQTNTVRFVFRGEHEPALIVAYGDRDPEAADYDDGSANRAQ